MNEQEYIDWYISKFKYPGVFIEKLMEEAPISYQCMKHIRDLTCEKKKLEFLIDSYSKS